MMRTLPTLLAFFFLTAPAEALAVWRSVTVATFNMSHGVGGDNVYNLYRTAALIQSSGADIVLLQDVDIRYYDSRSGCEDQPTRLVRTICIRNHGVEQGPNQLVPDCVPAPGRRSRTCRGSGFYR